MKFLVSYWHSLPSDLEDKLNSFCTMLPKVEKERQSWSFEGSFDDFYKNWNNRFLFFPSNEDGYVGTFYVTDKKHFGQC